MSLSAAQIDVSKVYDPRIDVLKDREFVITRGANKVAYTPYRSASTGTSAMSFNVVPSSRKTFIDRKMYIESTISLVFSATLAANPGADFSFVAPNSDAPRSFPLSRAIASVSAQIGNGGANMQTSDVIDQLLRCMPCEELKDFNSGCPTALDKSQTYECFTNDGSLNVLGNYQSGTLENGELPRGVFQITSTGLLRPAAEAGKYVQVVQFKVYEPVMLSSLVWQKVNHSGLIGIQSMSLQYNFANNLAPLVWSGTLKKTDANLVVVPNVDVYFAPITNIAADGSSMQIGQTDAALWVGTYSPPPLMEIPKQVTYNYYQVEKFNTTGYAGLQYGSKTTISSNNIQLKVIPSMIIAGVRRTKASQKWYHPDCYYKIDKAAINFANNTGILSTASPFNLFQISRKNGLNSTYNQWVGKYGSFNNGTAVGKAIPSGTGGLLVMKPNEDWGLGDGEASGVAGAYNFQISLDIECIDPSIQADTTEYELVVVVINEGQLTIDVEGTGNVSTNIGIVSEADVLKSETKPWMNYNEINGLVGGDFLGSLRNWGKKAASLVHTAADLAPKASSALKSVGLGRGAGFGAGLIGSGVSGGALLSQKSLKDRLRD